jgi:hypothetical protein
MRINATLPFLVLFFVLISACATTKEVPAVTGEGFEASDTPADSITAVLPDYSSILKTVKGKGKAIISEPNNSNRVTLYFSGNRDKSLITIKNSIGIEGGQLLSDGDSLLVYNKVDKYARKISLKNGTLDNINNLASVNILKMLNMTLADESTQEVLENKSSYLIQLQSGGKIYVNKEKKVIEQINRPRSTGLPYSQIRYDGYSTIESLTLPRRITIFSADKSAKVDLLIQSLEVNPELDELAIDLPEDIKFYRE